MLDSFTLRNLGLTSLFEYCPLGVMKLVKSLIGWEVTLTGRGSEYHETFARGIFRID